MSFLKPLIPWQMQADITAAAINQQDRRHILSCLPTGMGKTLPMLLTAQLLPPGDTNSWHMHQAQVYEWCIYIMVRPQWSQ